MSQLLYSHQASQKRENEWIEEVWALEGSHVRGAGHDVEGGVGDGVGDGSGGLGWGTCVDAAGGHQGGDGDLTQPREGIEGGNGAPGGGPTGDAIREEALPALLDEFGVQETRGEPAFKCGPGDSFHPALLGGASSSGESLACGGGEGGSGAREDEGVDVVWIVEGEDLGDHAAQEEANDVCRGEARGAEQGVDIAGKVLYTPGLRGCGRASMAPQVHAQDAKMWA